NWKTFIGIANLATQTQTIALSFIPDGNSNDSGPVNPPGTPVTVLRNLPLGGTVGDSVASLFALPSDKFTAGWIHVFGSGPLAGAVAYQDSTAGSLATIPSQTSGASRFFFAHIAGLFPWYTGIALLNTTNYAANVEISAINSSGQLIGSTASFSLPGGSRSTKLLSEFVPSVTQQISDGGFVYIRTSNSVPLFGFELFGHAVFPILANVQGFPLSSTSAYLSPIPTNPISGFTVADLTTTDGTDTKTQFAPR